MALYALDYDSAGRAETIQIVDPSTNDILNSQVLSNFSNGVYLLWNISGQVKINVISSAGPNAVVSGLFFGSGGDHDCLRPQAPERAFHLHQNCPPVINAVTFNGIDTTTQGAWKGTGNFNAPPASSSLVYGKDGDILPDTEGCDTACNPFPSYVSFGPAMRELRHAGQCGRQAI